VVDPTDRGMVDPTDRGMVDPTDRGAAEGSVRQLYLELHERAPGAIELAEWAGQLQAGLPPAQMRQAVLDSTEYRERQRNATARSAIAGSGLFDASWYLRRYRDVAAAGLDALKHYIEHGWREDRAPNAYFDPVWYHATSGISRDDNALLHYAGQGEAQGLAPGPNFDPVWYRTTYALPAASSPLADFLARRHDGTVAPCARLWSVRGLPETDAAEPGDDPFLRFVQTASPVASADKQLLEASEVLDRNFYALHSSDVMEAQMDPLDHFCEFGWREMRQPNFYFNLRWYLATNPDAAQLGVNPLLHYLLVGEPAGRRPIVFFDPAWYRGAYDIAPYTSPLAHYLANRRSQKYSPHALFDPAWYMAHSEAAVYPRRDPFSHFLIAGMQQDVAPSAAFDPAAWRRRTRGRPSRGFKHLLSPEKDNPLVNYLLATYR
jgi:hypothetical protein